MDTRASNDFPVVFHGDGACALRAWFHGSAGQCDARHFTLGYRRKVVALAAGLADGELGAMLRREGRYPSRLTHWRRPAAVLVGVAA